jgi:hypothetical protein
MQQCINMGCHIFKRPQLHHLSHGPLTSGPRACIMRPANQPPITGVALCHKRLEAHDLYIIITSFKKSSSPELIHVFQVS